MVVLLLYSSKWPTHLLCAHRWYLPARHRCVSIAYRALILYLSSRWIEKTPQTCQQVLRHIPHSVGNVKSICVNIWTSKCPNCDWQSVRFDAVSVDTFDNGIRHVPGIRWNTILSIKYGYLVRFYGYFMFVIDGWNYDYYSICHLTMYSAYSNHAIHGEKVATTVESNDLKHFSLGDLMT